MATKAIPPCPQNVPVPPGWRRAKASELTNGAKAAAVVALQKAIPIGKLQAVNDGGKVFGFLTEWHYDDHVTKPGNKIWHPGISTLVPIKQPKQVTEADVRRLVAQTMTLNPSIAGEFGADEFGDEMGDDVGDEMGADEFCDDVGDDVGDDIGDDVGDETGFDIGADYFGDDVGDDELHGEFGDEFGGRKKKRAKARAKARAQARGNVKVTVKAGKPGKRGKHRGRPAPAPKRGRPAPSRGRPAPAARPAPARPGARPAPAAPASSAASPLRPSAMRTTDERTDSPLGPDATMPESMAPIAEQAPPEAPAMAPQQEDTSAFDQAADAYKAQEEETPETADAEMNATDESAIEGETFFGADYCIRG